MNTSDITRRAFFARSGAVVGGGWIAAILPDVLKTAAYVADAGDAFAYKVLSDAEAREVEAIATLIIPSDETPGAKEAGAVRFVDRALETFMAGAADGFRSGLNGMLKALREAHPGAAGLSSLEPDDQLAFLKTQESSPFFGLVRFLVIAGTFAHPSHGGNQDKLGWRLIGFEDRHAWAPPFGDYEEEVER